MSLAPVPILVDTLRSPYARLRPVPLSAVSLQDGFWSLRQKLTREASLPAQYRLLEDTGRLDNFRRAAGNLNLPYRGYYFNDSDVYKWLEAASWSLACDPSPELSQMVAEAIELVAGAQRPDGYLDTYFTGSLTNERWKNLRDQHELYCAGHLFQAAVAHYRATDAERLLDIACRFARHIVHNFGPQGQAATPGHPEVEMALVELYRMTGEKSYLDQALSFLNNRGRGLIGGSEYHLDHVPFRQMKWLGGHAVRALYLCAGAADLYLETGDPALREALERLWLRMATRQVYVSGGVGARHEGEAFGGDYELPNARAYTETCAAIASVMWNWRMLQLDGEARYADLMEWTLYNGVLPGISLDGLSYFYVNPLESDGSHLRQPWYDCACCPPNIARLLASIPAYFYSTSEEGIWVHLYAQGQAEINVKPDLKVILRQVTRYPWEGKIQIEVIPQDLVKEFSLFLRIPSWVGAGTTQVLVNNAPVEQPDILPGAYFELRRNWGEGDQVRLELPMPPRFLASHPFVLENQGRVAVARGPILYCAEAIDNQDHLSAHNLHCMAVQTGKQPELQAGENGLGDLEMLTLQGIVRSIDPIWRDHLYCPYPISSFAHSHTDCSFTLIPYYAWANRTPGSMRVWLPVLE